jgi:hypothetical protein
MDLTDIFRTFYSTAAVYSFFSAHATFFTIGYIGHIGQISSFNIFLKIEIISYIFLDHNRVEL